MVFVRTKTIRGHRYCYLVYGKWINGSCRQKVIRYLGREKDIKRTSEN